MGSVEAERRSGCKAGIVVSNERPGAGGIALAVDDDFGYASKSHSGCSGATGRLANCDGFIVSSRLPEGRVVELAGEFDISGGRLRRGACENETNLEQLQKYYAVFSCRYFRLRDRTEHCVPS